MNHSRDEVRRQLRAARIEHDAAMAPWREALLRIFGSDNALPSSAKAQLLGVPSRRGFLKIGGATVLGAAVLAACGSEAVPDVSESGAPNDATTTTADPADTDFDLDLLRTATSLASNSRGPWYASRAMIRSLTTSCWPYTTIARPGVCSARICVSSASETGLEPSRLSSSSSGLP